VSTWKKILITAVVCLIGGFIAGLCLKGCSKTPDPKPVIIQDSILVHDTAYIIKHTTPKEVVRVDTCWLPAVDSSQHNVDSTSMVQVEVPITAYEYHDTIKTDSSSIEMGVYFSGYKAKIDSTSLKYHFEVQPQIVEKESGWGWSVTVGPYVGYGITISNGQVLAGPEIGLGVQLGIGYQKKFKPLKLK